MEKDQNINIDGESTTVVGGSRNTENAIKAKRRRKSEPRDSPFQRSSVYRGVTRHRWTGRYEAHLWDKNCWNESQNKKGKQVYLGAYDDEEAAAHAYDLAALKYWGHDTLLNFPVTSYQEELKEMEGQTREEYIGSLRRKSSGFSRGVSKYRGVARHHHNGRWEARIGRVFGNKYLYLGTYATQEEAATAYDMAAIEFRGLNAVTNFDLSRYAKWLRPNSSDPNSAEQGTDLDNQIDAFTHRFQQPQDSVGGNLQSPGSKSPDATSSAIGLLLQTSKLKEMLELSSIESSTSLSACDSRPSHCSFPDDIQTYFECKDGGNCNEEEDSIFGDLSSFISPMFQC